MRQNKSKMKDRRQEIGRYIFCKQEGDQEMEGEWKAGRRRGSAKN